LEIDPISAFQVFEDVSRYFRDAHTITQHAFLSASGYESCGQYFLGLPTEWPFCGIEIVGSASVRA